MTWGIIRAADRERRATRTFAPGQGPKRTYNGLPKATS